MYSKAIRKYFIDINIFNVPFSLVFALTSGIFWGVVIFSSIGILIGYLGHQTFRKNEYYVYYNLGFTETNLLTKIWLINMAISFLIILIDIIL